MTIWKQPLTLSDAAQRSQGTLVDHLGIEFTHITNDSVTARMPIDSRTQQPIGIMHGGASCVLAETVGSLAANYAVDQSTHICVGLSINTSHIRSVKSGFVHGTAIPKHLGGRTHVWQIDIHNDDGQLISSSRLTMMVLDRKKKP